MALPPLVLRVVTDTKGATRGLATFRTAAKGALLGIGALAAGAVVAFRSFEEAQKSVRQTNAVLKSTGGVANVTARDISRLSTSLMKKAAIDDEVIRGGANLLLTFTKIRNETGKGNRIFDQATKAALDMSVAMDQDLKSSVIQVGKALNDPVKGMTALRRVGVSFTDAQTDMVEKWVESGEVLKAQKFVLQELNTEFGGSAEAQKTATAAMGVAFGELAETVGKFVAPAITFLLDKLTVLADFLSANVGPAFRSVRDWLQNVWDAIGPAVTAFGEDLFAALSKTWQVIVQDVWPALQRLWKALQPVLEVVGVVAAAVLYLALKALPVIAEGVAIVVDALATLIDWISRAIGWIGGKFLGAWNAIKGPVMAVINGIIDGVRTLVGWIKDAVEWIQKLAAGEVDVGNFGTAGGTFPGFENRRQLGGPVSAGTPYIVGEAGPEWFVPKVSGMVLPNGEPGTNVTLHIHGDIYDADRFVDKVAKALNRAASRA